MLKGDQYRSWVLGYFDKYSPSLNAGVKNGSFARLHPTDTASDLYLCPICLQTAISRELYFIDQIITHQPDIDFDRDHYPPKSIGGASTVLVCVNCNNGFGTDIDEDAKKYLEARYFKAGIDGSSIGLKLEVPWLAKPVNVKTTLKGNTFTSIVSKKFNPPEITPPAGPIKARYSFTYPSHNVLRRALLRAAYLNCFAFWGYDFAVSGVAKKLVQIIKGIEQHPSKGLGLFYIKGDCPESGIYEYTNDAGNFFMVFFKIGLKDIPFFERVMILIPSDSARSWEGLSFFDETESITALGAKAARCGIDCGNYEGYRNYYR